MVGSARRIVEGSTEKGRAVILDRTTAGATRSKATMLERERANEKNVYLVVVEGNEFLAVRASDLLCFNSFWFFFPSSPYFLFKRYPGERASEQSNRDGGHRVA